MNILQALFLGVVQGLTEFLPVSSSGHLVIAQSLIPGFEQPGVLFDVVLHLGTSLAVLVYFLKELKKLSISYYVMLIVGTIPAAVVGFLLKDPIEILFASTTLVGFALLITAFFNFMTDRAKSERKVLTIFDALWIGLFQGFAIFPGISRSGSTIFAGTSAGVDRKTVAEFSFLLSVPAILGASLLELFTLPTSVNFQVAPYIAGFIASFFVGIFAIRVVLKALTNNRFIVFSIYCAILGGLVILL